MCKNELAMNHLPQSTRQTINGVLEVLFPGQPFYCVFKSDNPPESCTMPYALAFTGRTLDVNLKPWLESRGEYQGRRPAIFFDDIAMCELSRIEAAGDSERETEVNRQLAIST